MGIEAPITAAKYSGLSTLDQINTHAVIERPILHMMTIDVPCPKCDAPVGSPCRAVRSGSVTEVAHHPARLRAADESFRVASGRAKYAGIHASKRTATTR